MINKLIVNNIIMLISGLFVGIGITTNQYDYFVAAAMFALTGITTILAIKTELISQNLRNDIKVLDAEAKVMDTELKILDEYNDLARCFSYEMIIEKLENEERFEDAMQLKMVKDRIKETRFSIQDGKYRWDVKNKGND